MSAKPRIEIQGLAPGETPSVVIRIPLGAFKGEYAELAEQLLGKFFGMTPAPVAPLATRGKP